MVDRLKGISIQDIAMADALGMDRSEVEHISLMKQKNNLHRKAFCMRDDGVTITQCEADELNRELRIIINALMENDYDPMGDYIVDFDSFVVGNEYYGKFAW